MTLVKTFVEVLAELAELVGAVLSRFLVGWSSHVLAIEANLSCLRRSMEQAMKMLDA